MSLCIAEHFKVKNTVYRPVIRSVMLYASETVHFSNKKNKLSSIMAEIRSRRIGLVEYVENNKEGTL